MKTRLFKNQLISLRASLALAAMMGICLVPNFARASSATWSASPTDNNWISSNMVTTATVNNWSTGLGNWPGGNSTGSGDTATFNSASTQTTVIITNVGGIGTWNIKNITFDTASCAAYTITNTGTVTARFTAGGAITMNSTVTQPQLITGSQYRLHTTGGMSLVNNSATATATLTFGASVKANNSAETLQTDQAVNLQGSNTGSNVVSGVIADYQGAPSLSFLTAVTKSGTGTWYLTANNTYTGPTIITGGLLVLGSSGTINSSTNVIINGATLRFNDAMTLNAVFTNGTAALSCMFVTNSGTLQITNTAFQTPVTVSILEVSNATLRVGVNGSTPFTNIVVTSASGLIAGPNTAFIIDQVANVGNSTTFSLISYTGADPVPGNFSVTGPIAYNIGAVTVDTVHKLVQVTVSPGVALPDPKPVTWNGTPSGDWDTTTANWVNAGNPTNYVNLTSSGSGDPVTFDDSLTGTANVNLTTALSPVSITVNNTHSNYVFAGSGSLGGSASLSKQGPATLLLDNSGNNTFGGAITIGGGTLQSGNNDANGNLPSAGIVDNGALAFNRTDTFTTANVISGTGSLALNGGGTLTLSAATSSYGGGTTINGGTVRPTGVTSLGTGGVTVNTGGTLVETGGDATNNAITLAGGTLGVSSAADFILATSSSMTIAASTTNILQSADPQNPNTSKNIEVDAILHGSGVAIVLNATNITSPDGNQGVRFRTTAASDFSGTIIYTNNTKGELSVTGAGPFSPVGTGNFILYAGTYFGTNGLLCPVTGGYLEFNLRNSGGTTMIPNNYQIAGSGAVVINGLGTGNGAVVTLGSLTIGGGQELIGYRAAGTTTNTANFTTVTLTGGNATFTPHSPTFGVANQAGTDFSLGNISQTSASGIIMAGVGNLTLTGTNTYTGNTTVNSGRLALTGSGSISNTPVITVASGATFDVGGLTSAPFVLNASQTLNGSGMVVGTLAVAGGSTLGAGSATMVGTLANTGSTLMQGGGTFVVKVQNATSGTGVGNDSLAVSGNIGVLSSSGSKFTIKLASLDGTGAAGAVTNFNNTTNYTWIIATGTVTNFNASAFTVDTSGFSNPLGGGQFFVGNTGSSLVLLFKTAVSVGGAGGSISNPALNGSGNPTFSGHGIPGYTYGVESSTVSVSGPWVNAGPDQASSTVTAAADGSWSFTDANQTNPPLIFYRLYYPYSATPPQ